MNKCLYCGKEIVPKDGQYSSSIKNKKFCDLSCCASYNGKLKKDKQLKEYLDNPNKCLCCNNPILPKEGQRLADVKRKKYCCSSCSASISNKQRTKNTTVKICLNCGKEINARYDKKYCNNSCQAEYQYKTYIQEWKQGLQDGMSGEYQTSKYIKKYLREKYDNKCCKCGWNKINPYSGIVPLELHHIDGNYRNNSESNLELLCPNCHALSPNYGSLNRGNGREGRYK